MNIEHLAKEQILTTKTVYLASPERMFSEFKGERENIKNYNGRQLLEMLQNADDAAAKTQKEKKALISLHGSSLIIANTGSPFSTEGLRSIFHSHLSPKEAIENQIGKKGLGFRSILSWSEKIIIRSSDTSIAFSTLYSAELLKELLDNENFRLKFDGLNIKNHKQPISTLVCPKVVKHKIPKELEEFDTIISIELKANARAEVEDQIAKDIDGEVLLFLNSLESIVIDVDGNRTAFSKKKVQESTLIEQVTSQENKSSNWNIKSLKGVFEDLAMPYEISFAWKEALDESRDYIYSYFRTKVPLKCKGILHGSFELNADRNLIIQDEDKYNARLIGLLPKLLTECSAAITKTSDKVSYAPLSVLDINLDSLSNIIDTKKLLQEIKDNARLSAVFPVISNNYIDWEADPVHYDCEELTTHLDPESFPDVLHWCTDPFCLSFITETNSYKLESVVKNIISKRSEIPISQYASIVLFIHSQTKDNNALQELSLFFDRDMKPLHFSSAIFFPEKKLKYEIPSEISLQIIHPSLAEELLRQSGKDSYEALCSALPNYELKQYELFQLIETVISHYSANPDNSRIIAMHHQLYKIFLSYNPEKNDELTLDVLILTKKSSLSKVSAVYLSKELGGQLAEEIYSYNKHKIVASPVKFGLETDLLKWKKYLLWLGIASFPRFVRLQRQNQYAEYSMKGFNFKQSIEGRHFIGGYSQFTGDLASYGAIIVHSLDDLDGILKNNKSEKILQLINEYAELREYLEQDTEPKGSVIYLNFHYAKKTPSVSAADMRSFILWKLKNTAWINTESQRRSAPDQCSTAAYINEDFRGLIERPLFDPEILRRCKISRDKFDYLLSLVGIHRTINTFSTELLYSILHLLPEIDPEGKKTKTIYNQLSVNFDRVESLNKKDRNYMEYHRSGKVLCRNGEFMPISEAYYVNDKRYGESITARFNTIEIERRRGRDKIRKLFGVEPLDELELSVDGNPLAHGLNSIFISEMEAFKPYVYVLRKDMDSGNERTAIKEVKFVLVNSLALCLKKTEKVEIVNLADYEYFYDKAKRTVYINTSQNYHDLSDLKEDIHICSSVAEAWAAVLDVDSHRHHIRELFSKSPAVRDELLRSELDDNSLQKLNEARGILGIASNPRAEFWTAYIKCLKKGKYKYQQLADQQLLQFLTASFPNQSPHITAAFSSLNYDNINEEDNSEIIVGLLSLSGIDFPQFNEFLYPPIEIASLCRRKFKETAALWRETFISHLYAKINAENKGQQNFINLADKYGSLEGITFNTVFYEDHLSSYFKTAINDTFGIVISDPVQKIDLAEIYQANMSRILADNQITENAESLFRQFLKDHHIYSSSLHFSSQLGKIYEAFSQWSGNKSANPVPSSIPSKRIGFGKDVILYSDLADLKTQADRILHQSDLKGISINIIKTAATSPATAPGRSQNSGRPSRSAKTQKEEIGFLGEYIVYNYLLKNLTDTSSLTWVSDYARQCGVNSLGGDGHGYDIEYIPNNAKHIRYVEVKVVGREDAFHITPGEIQFGEKNKQHHEIFLVRNIENPMAVKIERILNLFDYKGKSFNSNDSFSVLNDSYVIKFNKQ